MTTALTTSILQRIRDLLSLAEDYPAPVLAEKLRAYRNQIHPDRFPDPNAKKDADAKFKEAQSLLDELHVYIQNETVQMSPTDLAVYQGKQEDALLRFALDAARQEAESLKGQLDWKTAELDKLQRALAKQSDEEHKAERAKLEQMYRPTPSNLASLGIVLALTALLAAMTKVKEVADFIATYSPLGQGFLKTTLFVIFVLMATLTVKRYIENIFLRARVSEVCSVRFCTDFMKYIRDSTTTDSIKRRRFDESQAFDFISGKETRWTRLLAKSGFHLFHAGTHEALKNCFIDYMLQRKLIELSHADDLVRTFVILDNSRYWEP